MPARPRDLPYVHVSYLAKLIAGEAHCEWAAWFKSQFNYDKRPDNYSGSDSQIKHTKLLRKQQTEMEGEGFTITVERQNDFLWKGKTAYLAGTPDIVAVMDEDNLIVDVKSGAPVASHEVQVLIYMWVVPIWFHRYKDKTFRGLLVYEDEHRFIDSSKLTKSFIGDVSKLMRQLADTTTPLRKVPSARECRYCKIGEVDCPDRVQEEVLLPILDGSANEYF